MEVAKFCAAMDTLIDQDANFQAQTSNRMVSLARYFAYLPSTGEGGCTCSIRYGVCVRERGAATTWMGNRGPVIIFFIFLSIFRASKNQHWFILYYWRLGVYQGYHLEKKRYHLALIHTVGEYFAAARFDVTKMLSKHTASMPTKIPVWCSWQSQ